MHPVPGCGMLKEAREFLARSIVWWALYLVPRVIVMLAGNWPLPVLYAEVYVI